MTSGDSGYLFRVEERRPPSGPDLEEVRKQVEQDLSREKVEKATQELVQQALQVSDVKLFPEALERAGDDNPTE